MGGTDDGASSGNAGEANRAGAESSAGESSGGASGEGGEAITFPAGPYIPCPALGDKFQLGPDDAYNPDFSENTENMALAKAFACELDDTTGRIFTIERFELKSQVLEVLSTEYYFGNFDWFTVTPDCGPSGYVTPVTSFPDVFAEVLGPGVYTRVSCEQGMTEEQVPIPPQPVNIDCDHAVPLPEGSSNAYAEERVLDEPALFYSLTLPEPDPGSSWHVEIDAQALESRAVADVKLHGLSVPFEAEYAMSALNGGHPAQFEPPSAGTYCVEMRAPRGVKYSIFYDLEAG